MNSTVTFNDDQTKQEAKLMLGVCWSLLTINYWLPNIWRGLKLNSVPELHFEYSSFGEVFQRKYNIISYISFQHFETDNFVLSATKIFLKKTLK